MIALVFELILPLLFELFLQLFGGVLVELGLNGVTEAVENKPVRNPFLAGVGYALLGLAGGGLSLLIVPDLFIRHPGLRMANLMITPAAAGFALAAVHAWREGNGFKAVKLDSFLFGYIFALAFAIIRYSFGR